MDKNQTAYERGEIIINTSIDCSELDIAQEKANRLIETIKEAKSLADGLASTEINLKINV